MMKRITVIAAGFFVASTAHADDFRPHAYVGLGFGAAKTGDLESNVNDLQRSLAQQGLSTDAEYKDVAQAFSLMAGYRFHPSFALEAQYTYLGKFTADIHGRNYPVNAHVEARAQGFGLAGAVFLPVGQQAELFAKAGLFSSSFEAETSASSYRYSYSDSFSSRSTNPWLGVGLQIQTSANSKLRIEYEYYDKIGKKDGEFDGSNVDALMVSAQFSF